MKLIGFMNGWKSAPHCWRRFVFHPVSVDRNKAFTSVSLFGFVFFFDEGRNV